ncbi:MAG: hypothetical protein ACPGYV_14190, partial [Phycisphaeraceae bacterium]
GCNERCTYCVVPSVRGKEQSRMPEAIKLEMEGLAAQGFKEARDRRPPPAPGSSGSMPRSTHQHR